MITRCAGFLGMIAVVGLSIAATLFSNSVLSHDDAKKNSSADEELLNQSAKTFVEVFNKHDAKGLAALYTEDAELVQKDGTVVRGRSAIEKGFYAYFESNPKAAISLEINELRFLTPDVAVENGASVFFPDGETESLKGRYTVLHVKKDGKWSMASTRSLEDEVVSNFAYLNDLDWLLGDWVDEGADAVVETNFKWSDGKNFILGEFNIVSGGGITMKGTQRIGWDPEAKQIRAWSFDTEGGFGEATWNQIGDEWLVKSRGVRRDGSNVSFSRRFKSLSKDRILVISTDNIVGGEAQPDFKLIMVRKQPKAKG